MKKKGSPEGRAKSCGKNSCLRIYFKEAECGWSIVPQPIDVGLAMTCLNQWNVNGYDVNGSHGACSDGSGLAALLWQQLT